MIDGLLEALGAIGYAFDTPGALLRGALIGRPGERASGREMLEALGYSANQEGLDLGDVLGFGAEMVLDPLNLLPGYAALKGAKHLKRTKALNKASDALLETGGMPAEIAAKTLVRDPVTGQPTRLYHGTTNVFDRFDPSKQGDNLFSEGSEVAAYLTDDPTIASSYAGDIPFIPDNVAPLNVRMQFADVRNPYNMDNSDLLELSNLSSLDDMPGEVVDAVLNNLDPLDDDELLRVGSYHFDYPPEKWTDVLTDAEREALKQVKTADAALKLSGLPYNNNDIANLTNSLLNSGRLRDVFGRRGGNESVYSALGYLHKGPEGRGPVAEAIRHNHENTLLPGMAPNSDYFFHTEANKHLRNAGYDAIQHLGGTRAGRGDHLHNVTIPFEVDQIYSPWVVPDRIAETRGGYPGAILGFETAKAANQYQQNRLR